MATSISSRPLDCSRAEAAIDDTSSTIPPTDPTISFNALPARPTSETPYLTRSPEVEIRSVISRAASDDLLASPRTSDETAANPQPASAARAALTQALSTRRFVWKAMSSTTPMIREICSDEFSILPIASTAFCTTAPEASAFSRAEFQI